MAPAIPTIGPIGTAVLGTLGLMGAAKLMTPGMPPPPPGPGEPPDPAVMPDPEDVVAKKRKQRASAAQLQGGGTVLSGETLGGGY